MLRTNRLYNYECLMENGNLAKIEFAYIRL